MKQKILDQLKLYRDARDKASDGQWNFYNRRFPAEHPELVEFECIGSVLPTSAMRTVIGKSFLKNEDLVACMVDAEFVILAANDWMKLIDSLEIATKALDTISQDPEVLKNDSILQNYAKCVLKLIEVKLGIK